MHGGELLRVFFCYFTFNFYIQIDQFNLIFAIIEAISIPVHPAKATSIKAFGRDRGHVPIGFICIYCQFVAIEFCFKAIPFSRKD